MHAYVHNYCVCKCSQVRTLVSLDKQEEAAMALNSALQTHPSSVPLWLLRLEMVVGVASLVCTGEGQGEVMEEEEEGVVLEVEKRRELGVVCRRALDHIPVKVHGTTRQGFI